MPAPNHALPTKAEHLCKTVSIHRLFHLSNDFLFQALLLTGTGCENSHQVISLVPVTSSFIDIIFNNIQDRTVQDRTTPGSGCNKVEGEAFIFISCPLSPQDLRVLKYGFIWRWGSFEI